MENEKIKLQNVNKKTSELKILFDCLFEIIKYYQYETGKFSKIESLCEKMDEQFKELKKCF